MTQECSVRKPTKLEYVYEDFFTTLSVARSRGKMYENGKYFAIKKADFKEAHPGNDDEKLRDYRALGLIHTEEGRLDKIVRINNKPSRYVCMNKSYLRRMQKIWNADDRKF